MGWEITVPRRGSAPLSGRLGGGVVVVVVVVVVSLSFCVRVPEFLSVFPRPPLARFDGSAGSVIAVAVHRVAAWSLEGPGSQGLGLGGF